jgi:glycosyltransferase involved in cell wall biosynthesis
MRLLFIADGRSPIALNWIEYFLERGDQVHLISTYACKADERLASFSIVPVGFSGLKVQESPAVRSKQNSSGIWGAKAVGLRTRIRQWLGPITVKSAAKQVNQVVGQIQPQLVHAMRIPFEGMIAASAKIAVPLLVSVWGNDFTLHARANPWMGWLTRNTLMEVDAIQSDCDRDLRLAQKWGFDARKPGLVVPGAGGIQAEIFYPPEEITHDERRDLFSVVNPRGIRAYIRNDIFFRSIPLVLQQQPETKFYCPTMAGELQAEKWVRELGIEANTVLMPRQTRQEMANLFRQADIVVSPSVHDGTPNTLLEAMACGCFPVAGDLESIREWIIPGENGYLVNPNDPQALANAILSALTDPVLLEKARRQNTKIISERANYRVVMEKVRRFYETLVE